MACVLPTAWLVMQAALYREPTRDQGPLAIDPRPDPHRAKTVFDHADERMDAAEHYRQSRTRTEAWTLGLEHKRRGPGNKVHDRVDLVVQDLAP